MKKFLSLVLVMVIVLSTFTPVLATSSKGNIYEEAGKILKDVGILEGSTEEGLMLDKNLRRQDMVILISRLHKEENTAKEYPIKSNFKDIKDDFYQPYISWAVYKELIQGRSKTEFGYNYHTTVQEYQTVLLRSLGYGEEANNWDEVPKLAEKIKIMEGLSTSPNQKLSRGLMAAMTMNALKTTKKDSKITLAQHLKIDIPGSFTINANSTIEEDTFIIEGIATNTKDLHLLLSPLNSSTNERKVKVPLDKDGKFLVKIPNLDGGDYKYQFISGNQNTVAKTITIEEAPFALLGISSENLKEVAINFTAPVDISTSQFPNDYFTDAGSVKSVRLEDNNKRIVLTLNKAMNNQGNYKLSTNRIVSSKGEKISIKDEEFIAYDDQIPKVKEVKQLGNKGLRIFMSEPVKFAQQSNFKIDNNKIFGEVKLDDNVITLIYFPSYPAPKEGQHILTVSGLEDYANYRGVDENIPFDIVKDIEPPKVIDYTANTEEVIIQFNKEIDPSSITRTNFYYKSGSIKKYPNTIKTINDKVILSFSGSSLPIYEISLYINNLADYSGNKIGNKELKIKPIIDKTNPEVLELKVSEDGKSIKIHFSKNVKAENRSYYTIKNEKDSKVSIRGIEGSGREYTIRLNSPLPEGRNTINIEGVQDTTALKNRLIDYSEEIFMKDLSRPTIINHSGSNNQIVVQFDKEMDHSTIENPENYLIHFNGRRSYLPSNTEFHLSHEQTYIITLPESIDGKTVDIGKTGNLKELDLISLKATNGMSIDPITLTFTNTSKGQAIVNKAELVEPGLIKIQFNQPIYGASPEDFSIKNMKILDVRGGKPNEVEITLDNENTSIEEELVIKANNNITTTLNTGIEAGKIKIDDKVSPYIKPDIGSLEMTGRSIIHLPFTEALDGVTNFFNKDLIVEADGVRLDESDYSISINKNIINIQIINPSSTYQYSVGLVDKPQYIMDKSGNIAESSSYEYFTR